MNLGEIKSRAWWTIDDNETSPTEITAAVMLTLINDALADLAPSLNINKSAAVVFVAGVGSLPADFVQPIAVYDGTTRLYEITSIVDKAEDTAATSQYFIPDNSHINIYGLTPAGTVTLHYLASPVALSADADIPVEVPVKYHAAIAEMYVKAKYYAKLSRNSDASDLMRQWEQVKREIFGVTHHDRRANADYIVDVYADPQMSGGGSSW